METSEPGLRVCKGINFGDQITIPAVASIANCTVVVNDNSDLLGLLLETAGGGNGGTLTIYGSNKANGTFAPLYATSTGTATAVTVASTVVPSFIDMPAAVRSCPYLKFGAATSVLATPVRKG